MKARTDAATGTRSTDRANSRMTTRLTDTERTLLSAYRDGELSAQERAEADRLLASSPEAREYLIDLRSLARFSAAAFPTSDAAGAAFGTKLTSGAIQTAARSAGRASLGGRWLMTGIAGAAAVVVAVVSLSIGDADAPAASSTRSSAPSTAPRTTHANAQNTLLSVDASSLLVPAITHADLIDFAVSGCLPIDASRDRYVTVRQQSGQIAIKMHDAPSNLGRSLGGIRLDAVPGLDSLGRAIRTSLLQSDGNGLAVNVDLPSLRLGVIEALQEAADELPMSAARQELDREYLRLSNELKQSRLDWRRERDNGVRYVVVAGTDLQKAVDRHEDVTYTFAPNDRRVQTLVLSGSDRGSLDALVRMPLLTAAPVEPRTRASSPVQRVFTRRPLAARAPGKRANTAAVSSDTAISFETIQHMQSRGQTLDGVFNSTEHWFDRAEQILERAEEIRRRIEILRQRQLAAPDSSAGDSSNDDEIVGPNDN